MKFLRRALVAVSAMGALALGSLVAMPAAQAITSVTFVSPSGNGSNAGTSCASAQYTHIQDAVDSTSTGGSVIVCPGTYHEYVTIDHQLSLIGQPGAVIDASYGPYGVGVTADNSRVLNLTVINAGVDVPSYITAPFDGIITAGFTPWGIGTANHVTISGNTVYNNVGAGIDIETSSNNTVVNNNSHDNGIGINVTDDFGSPASHNVIQGNQANNNAGGCGIVLADHTGAGIFSNTVVGNTANNNGLGTSTAPMGTSGSGIILAGGVGGVYNNIVQGNTFNGNGHAGIALHGHAPGMNFAGNILTGNTIGTNNVLGDQHDPNTTGIYLGDASPLTITVSGNRIHDDYYGIFKAGNVTIIGSNTFTNVTVPVGSTPTF